MQDMPEEDRPRERLLRLGANALSDAELLALFINTGRPGENAMQVAQRLIRSHRSLRYLARLSGQQLQEERALGPAKAALIAAAFELGRRAAIEKLEDEPLNTPEAVYQFASPGLRDLSHEVVRVLLVNTRLRFIRQEQISHGSINEAMAYPRDVLRPVLVHAAYGFVLVHNHPSGDPTPSEADRQMTRRVREAAELMGVQFLDHLIIGAPSTSRAEPFFSFRQAGLI